VTATVETLRADIDAGRTRDKVAGPDPAAAPLGADEEAAGTPISSERARLARSHEVDAPSPQKKSGALLFYFSAIGIITLLLVSAVTYLIK
jgi:hypothetical protein